MIEVAINPQARDFLRSRDANVVRIELAEHRSWSGAVIRPAVLAGAPENSEGYARQQVDGLDIYISDNIKADSGIIRVGLGGWGPFRSVVVEGASACDGGCNCCS